MKRGEAFAYLVVLLALRGPVPSKAGRQWLQAQGFRKKAIDDATVLAGLPHGATTWALPRPMRWPKGLDADRVACMRHERARAQASVFQRNVYRRVRTGGTAYGGRRKGRGD